MATTATTLSGAITPDAWIIALANNAGIKPGDNIVCEQESMKVLVVGAGAAAAPLIVYRGSRGTAGKAHAGGVAATFGGPSEYGVGVGVASVPLEGEGEAAEAPPEDE